MSSYRYFLMVFIVVSCSTARFKLKTDYRTQDNQQGNLVFEKSYDLGGYKWSCWLTGLWYGGACWTYNFMPFEAQTERLVADAKIELMRKLNSTGEITFIGPEIRRVSWNDSSTIFNNHSEDRSGPMPKTPASMPKVDKDKLPDDEFLR